MPFKFSLKYINDYVYEKLRLWSDIKKALFVRDNFRRQFECLVPFYVKNKKQIYYNVVYFYL